MMTELFDKPKKNKFDLSHEVKMSSKMGYLYPCFIQEVIPGDSYRVETQGLHRLSPLLAPPMQRIDWKVDYFYVPYRLVWSEWKDFITGGEDGTELPSFPRVEVNTTFKNNHLSKGSLADYMGVPITLPTDSVFDSTGTSGNTNNQHLSLLYFRAYQLIWHEYFRDQNVGAEYTQFVSSGIVSNTTDIEEQFTLRRSNWEKDYFTSALPFLQRGAEITLPLGATADVEWKEGQTQYLTKLRKEDGNFLLGYSEIDVLNNPGGIGGKVGSYSLKARDTLGTSYINLNLDGSENYQVDLSTATSATINELRKATALQRWLELMARGGSRYREQIHTLFGERIPDYTVQVPQHLGGGKVPIMMSEVIAQAQESATSERPLGSLGGHGIGVFDNIGFTQSFDEHGVILGVCRTIPKNNVYKQGLSRFFQKFDKFDHYFPQFANLGEQEIYNKEIYIKGNATTDDAVFGYQQRYAEYKYACSRIAGDFRDTLNYWELSREFTDYPVLNQSFIECNPDDRIFAITDANEDKIWSSLYHKVDAIRPIPYHSNPSLT